LIGSEIKTILKKVYIKFRDTKLYVDLYVDSYKFTVGELSQMLLAIYVIAISGERKKITDRQSLSFGFGRDGILQEALLTNTPLRPS
jgi:hypothetical protein